MDAARLSQGMRIHVCPRVSWCRSTTASKSNLQRVCYISYYAPRYFDSSACITTPIAMVAGQRYYYEQRVSGLSDGSTFMQVAVRIMGAGSSGWATPQFLQRSSARERQRLQLSLTPQYERQYITITGAVGGTFKLQFEKQPGVSVR